MDEKIFAGLLDDYIKKNFQPPRVSAEVASFAGAVRMKLSPPKKRPEEINFRRLRAERKGETFSEMLLRLIIESGEDNSVVYKRANVDRRHFSKILNNNDYQPRKKTVLAFAVALKLDIDATQKFLATAGFTLSNTNLADVIVSFFIEQEIFDVDKVNQTLHKYDLPILCK